MEVLGTLTCVDHPGLCSFTGSVGPSIDGTGYFLDSTSVFSGTGIVISDSTRHYPDMTFTQGMFLGAGDPPTFFPGGIDWSSIYSYDGSRSNDPTAAWAGGDPPLYLIDKTYVGGYLDVDGTWKGGQYLSRWYDPIWINFSLWYTQYTPDSTLIGYRYREPVRRDVGSYYISMEVPRPTGQYEIRWLYQKDQSSYGREVVQGFLCESAGIDPDRT